MRYFTRLAAMAIVFALATPAFAQGGGGGGGGKGGFDPSKMPNKEEIKKKVKEYLEKAPSQTAELEGVAKVTYKQVPTDPKKIAESLGGGKQMPAGADVEAGMKAYAPMIQEVLNEVLADAGTFEALTDIKIKSKTVKKGSYKMGIEFDGEKPSKIVLNPGQKDAVSIPLTSKAVEDLPEVKIELVADKKNNKKFVIQLGFLKSLAKSAECEAKAEKK
jgi:hypothetical protein